MGYRQKGLTLIELMVTIAVLAIVVAIAIPSFNTLIANSRALSTGEELISALNYARAESIKRGDRVTLCGTTNGTACNGTWANDWIVVADDAATDDAASPVVGGVLRFWVGPKKGAAVTEAGAATFVRFTRKGTLGNSGGGTITLTAAASGCSGNSARQVTVGIAGVLSGQRTTQGCS
ncbi:GspH/FimT family pseudopilin [Microbulbifer sp. CAU 1566]|uniref:GspH/FimT family pseudopilin n=1 Tax=Microbulbifer sp. CAU 1566 TaxID=2933269 RepID=UPI0020056DCC|nr:GspH/FimT family pseudopilin [Microbulbifer sp. CAU 1566]MCK7598781.1 GspH/FimT family pseudopilin [Microbulbifer sp. CAU 1566]